ncbi:MAG: hypothetical protein C3F15_17820 [Holophagae bacterium]|nr:MAG: hypothetical protein C3F15_17820 [Holophagae bacterium]
MTAEGRTPVTSSTPRSGPSSPSSEVQAIAAARPGPKRSATSSSGSPSRRSFTERMRTPRLSSISGTVAPPRSSRPFITGSGGVSPLSAEATPSTAAWSSGILSASPGCGEPDTIIRPRL